MATSPGPLQRSRFVFSLDLDQVPSATKRIAKEEPGNQIVSMLHFFFEIIPTPFLRNTGIRIKGRY